MKAVFLCIPVFVAACTSVMETQFDDNDTSDFSSVAHEEIVLGSKLEDPYSLDNMQNALDAVYPTRAGRDVLKATDLYVRFLPRNNDEYDQLIGLGLQLIDHPLDYSIVKDGDYYHDPSLGEDEITWQYAVVNSDFVFPKRIIYEVLESCYIPDTDGITRADGIDWQEVERKAFKMTGNENLLELGTKGKDYERTNPRGRITVVDERYDDGQPVGVQGVLVVVNTFVKFSYSYTDSEGYYEIPKKYASKIRYRLVFRNEKGFAIGLNTIIVPASTSTLGKNSPEGINVTVSGVSDAKLFCRCVVNNAAYDYFESCKNPSNPIMTPPSDTRFWLFMNQRSSSAPMLHQGVLLDIDMVSTFLGTYKDLVQIFLPDITLGLKNCESFSQIYSSTIHELAHSSHFMKVGTDYWNKYVMYILKSFIGTGGSMYGNGTADNAGYCEVGEMWAYYLENEMYRDRYAIRCPNYSTSYWFSPQILMNLDERGMSRSMIFQSLSSEVNSREKLMNNMCDLYPDNRKMIEQVFNRYVNVK